MEQMKKKVIPEVMIRGDEFRVMVDDAPHAGNGTKPAAGPGIGQRPAATAEQTGVAPDTVVKTGRIPQHSWGG